MCSRLKGWKPLRRYKTCTQQRRQNKHVLSGPARRFVISATTSRQNPCCDSTPDTQSQSVRAMGRAGKWGAYPLCNFLSARLPSRCKDYQTTSPHACADVKQVERTTSFGTKTWDVEMLRRDKRWSRESRTSHCQPVAIEGRGKRSRVPEF